MGDVWWMACAGIGSSKEDWILRWEGIVDMVVESSESSVEGVIVF